MAMELMVSVEVTGCVPEIAAGWLTVQVGEPVAPAGPFATAQVSATVPVNPPLGVMVRFDVAEPPGAKGLMGLPLIANEGAGPVNVKVALLTPLWIYPGAVAIALMVVSALIVIGPA